MCTAQGTLEEEYESEMKEIWSEYDERLKRRQAKIGRVVSTKNAKTISVEIDHRKFFPKYNKHVIRHRKIMAHDEKEEAQLGDVVRISPCRPMSRWKRHALVDILRRPKLSEAAEKELTKTIKQKVKENEEQIIERMKKSLRST